MSKYLKYAWVLLLALGGLLVWFATRKRPPSLDVATELKVVEQEASISRLLAEQGKAAALLAVLKEHEESLEALDAAKQKEAEDLRGDPVALSRFLVRAGKRKT